MHRSTVLRCLYASASKAGGRPHRDLSSAGVRSDQTRLRNDGTDPASTKMSADRAGGIRAVRQDGLRSSPRPAGSATRNLDARHDGFESWCITGLTRSDMEGQGPCMTVDGDVDLGAQAAARASEPVIAGFTAARCPLLLAPAACWCARQTVESTVTVHPMSSSTSAAVRMAARIRSQVPSTAHLISRLCAVWNEPSSSGRSRQGEQVRHFQAMASRVRRCSAHRRPRTGSAGMSGSIRLHIASVITDRTGTSDQLTSPPKRHALGVVVKCHAHISSDARVTAAW